MALRGPNRPQANPLRPATEKLGGGKLSNIEQSLIAAGVAKTPQEAKKLARVLLAALRGKGVPANTLPLAIKQFQKAAGLKQTGQLDAKTLGALQQQGLLPNAEKKSTLGGKAPGGVLPGKNFPGKSDLVVKAQPGTAKLTGQAPSTPRPIGTQGKPTGEAGHKVSIDQKASLVEHMATTESFGPQKLLENLSHLGFFAGGRGAEQLRSAVRSFQGKSDLPQTGKLDADTIQKLVEAGALPESVAAQLNKAESQAAQSSTRGDPSSNAAQEQARAESDQALHDANMRGVSEGKGDPDAADGRAADGEGKAKKKGQGGEGDGLEEEEDAGGLGDGDEDGTEDEDANAPAGDDDLEDEDRGHAQLKKEEAEAAHYAIAPLSAQLAEALEQIERDDDGRGPVTYAWDITFYKPGVYGALQPAEPLWHIGIEKVTAFDEVWERACDALAQRMEKLEPDVAPPDFSVFERALRRARARSTP